MLTEKKRNPMKINISLDSNWQINISFQCFILEQMGVPKQRLRKSFKTKNMVSKLWYSHLRIEKTSHQKVSDIFNKEITFPLKGQMDRNKNNTSNTILLNGCKSCFYWQQATVPYVFISKLSLLFWIWLFPFVPIN